jgi:hypothetical protein
VLGGLSALKLNLKICVILLGVSVIAKNVKPTKNMNKNVKKQVPNVRIEKNVIGWQLMLRMIDVPLAVRVTHIRSLAHNV